jgi:hypothetical protein
VLYFILGHKFQFPFCTEIHTEILNQNGKMMMMMMNILSSERWRAWSKASAYDVTNICSTDADGGSDGDDEERTAPATDDDRKLKYKSLD